MMVIFKSFATLAECIIREFFFYFIFLSSSLAVKRGIAVTILLRCMCVRPSEFVRAI